MQKAVEQTGKKITTTKPTLWHCHDSRSLRVLWTLEEMAIDYDLHCMQFPPRVFQPDYKKMNVLGTVPYFIDGDTHMTESSGICHYLVEKYGAENLRVGVTHPEYGDYINWLFMSDATLLFPQTLVLRYGKLEPQERRSKQIVEDYTTWFLARLKKLDEHLPGKTYLCDERFTVADIAVGYALFFGQTQGLDKGYSPQVTDYLDRIMQRPAYKRIMDLGEELSPFKHPELLNKGR